MKGEKRAACAMLTNGRCVHRREDGLGAILPALHARRGAERGEQVMRKEKNGVSVRQMRVVICSLYFGYHVQAFDW